MDSLRSEGFCGNIEKPCRLDMCTKREILAYFRNGWELNEKLYATLKDESVFYRYPDKLRLPLIFYFGHIAATYPNKLALAGLITPEERINLEYETLFEAGVDEMDWDDTEQLRLGGKFNWPSLKELQDYRSDVKDLVEKVIDRTPLTLPVTMDSQWWVIFLALEHDRIHLETSSVLIRQLPVDLVVRPKDWKYAPLSSDESVENSLIQVSESMATMGKPDNFPSYGWDNEYGRTTVRVPAFEASKFPITNREFLKFVEAGGYQSEKYWSKEGLKWLNFRKAKHPSFWVCPNGCKGGNGGDLLKYSPCRSKEFSKQMDKKKEPQYKLRLMFDVVDLPLDWPVEVNYHEAKAYSVWRGHGYRLPAEAEYHMMRALPNVSSDVDCDSIFIEGLEANFAAKFGSSSAVNMYPANKLGFHDIFGNVWEWTEDHINGFPGFKTHVYYDDFTSNQFDGRHNIIMGGSWISIGDEASRFARFTFRRHFFQHLGFRLARSTGKNQNNHVPIHIVTNFLDDEDNPVLLSKSDSPVYVKSANYQLEEETQERLVAQLNMEYKSERGWRDMLVSWCLKLIKNQNTKKTSALHVGCGVGSTTFKLAGHFDSLLGQDTCGVFIKACRRLQVGEDEGLSQETGVSDLGHDVVDTSNIIFKQISWISNELGKHDFILVTNIERALNPAAWLNRTFEVLKKHGLMIVVSRATQWKEKSLTSYLTKMRMVADDRVENGSDAIVFTAWRHL